MYVVTSPNSMEIRDAATGALSRSIPAGGSPDAVALTPDGATALVANYNGHSLSIVDLASGATRTVALGGQARAVDVSPDGRTAYVVFHDTDQLAAVTIATGAVRQSFAGSSSYALDVSADGATIWISNSDGSVALMDAATGTLRSRTFVGWGTQGIVAAPSDTYGYVASFRWDSLRIVGPLSVTRPADQSTTAGEPASFTVATSSVDPATTIAWQVSSDGGATWTTVPQATDATLTLPATTAAMNGQLYRAVVTDRYDNQVVSGTARLTVRARPTPTPTPTPTPSATTTPPSTPTATATPAPTSSGPTPSTAASTAGPSGTIADTGSNVPLAVLFAGIIAVVIGAALLIKRR